MSSDSVTRAAFSEKRVARIAAPDLSPVIEQNAERLDLPLHDSIDGTRRGVFENGRNEGLDSTPLIERHWSIALPMCLDPMEL